MLKPGVERATPPDGPVRLTLPASEGDQAATRSPSASVDWGRVLGWCLAGYILSLGAGIIYARSLIAVGEWTQGFPWEHDLLAAVHRVQVSAAVDRALLILPWFGTNITLLPLSLVAAIWLVRRGQRHLATHLVVLQFGTLTLSAVLKAFYDRPRPTLWEHRGQFAWASYPSGHAIASVAVPFTIAIMLWRARGWRWPFAVATAMLVVTSYSRLYLGVHWPSDVIAGLLMGVVWLTATLIAFRQTASHQAPATDNGQVSRRQ
jgi:membrane-associated phospholipid phosphatase